MRKAIPALSALPAGATIVDLSQWNGKPDARGAAGAGILEAIIRLGDGYAADPYAVRNWRAFSAYGMVMHAYWNFRPSLIWDLQAAYFLEMTATVSPIAKPRRLWLDCETAPLFPPRQPAAPIANCLARLEKAHRLLVGVYTRRLWWLAHVGTSPAWASKYHLWVAEWNPTKPAPRIPEPWKARGAELWQIGSYPAAWCPDSALVDFSIRLQET